MSDSVCCVCGGDEWVRAKPGVEGTDAQRWCIPCDPTVGDPVLTRAEAIERGIMFYHTGQPCQNGHIAPRYARGGECKECSKARIAKQRKSGRRSEIDAKYHALNKAIRNQTSLDGHYAKMAARRATP